VDDANTKENRKDSDTVEMSSTRLCRDEYVKSERTASNEEVTAG